jgi:phospholipase A1
MKHHVKPPPPHLPAIKTSTWFSVLAGVLSLYPALVLAQDINAGGPAAGWQHCAALTDTRDARLNCFDRWAAQQPQPSAIAAIPRAASAVQPTAVTTAPTPAMEPVLITMTAPQAHDCKNPQFSELSRFWELEAGSNCGTFGIRGYRPISLSVVTSDSVNTQPTSTTVGRSATSPLAYSNNEVRIQLSVRTKIAQGLLVSEGSLQRDSLWFGYTQQSYWQLFNGDLSRPFRSTDHEPELTYIYPSDLRLPGGWRMRYSGVSLVHQSNGQALPMSRSWNRSVLMVGMEKNNQLRLQARIWQRQGEDPANDDNPNIADYIGRAEIAGFWNVNQNNLLGATLRHNLRKEAKGSVRLEWFKNIGAESRLGERSSLRLHSQLFSGYGDSLVDYNRRRTVLSVGLSLVDW